ncbi:MAG TPA: VWA domain-containing protein [Candidatus Acidoferrales bacterium]|nr:VWA domain-containing protein [Candidatus Acidoferrales bacterium]
MTTAAKLTMRSLALLLAAAAPAFGQSQPSGPIQVKLGAQTGQQSSQQTGRVVIQVKVVTLPVAVSDRSHNLVLNLTQKDFQVFEDGKPQQIIRFDQGGDPLSIVLVLETSSRVAPLLPAVQKTGIIFTQMVMAATGEATVIGYNDEVDILCPMTTDSDAVLKTIEHVQPGLSGARLYDALNRAEDILEKEPSERRRIIVVVGEKNDKGSETKLGQVLRRAQLDNTSIYTIGLSSTAAEFRKAPERPRPVETGPPGTYPMNPPTGTMQTPSTVEEQMGNEDSVSFLPLIAWLVQHGANAVGKNALVLASTATGGLHEGTFKDNSIQRAMNSIGNDLHGDYLLAYRPPSNTAYGYHNIEVRVTEPSLKIRTRPGYFIAPPNE